MEQKYVLGVDPGTGSLGLVVRDTETNELMEQVKYASVDIVRSGVIESGQNKYTSFAAERRGYRNGRTRYMHTKWRKQETLELLIDEKIKEGSIKHLLCPLSYEDLERWVRYDKTKGLKREYPVDAVAFVHWLMMDFDGDGKVDGYTSPYQIRKELLERQFDFSNPKDCYKLGRALYHIAQKRGFRSSKGDTISDAELPAEDIIQDDDFDAMEYSEQKKSKKLTEYMAEKGIQNKSVGYALAMLEDEGVRLRDSEYQVVRKQLKDEVKAIFDYQKQLSTDSYLYKRLVSEKKGEGTIFYQQPLRSQRGKVEHCSLEPMRKRCKASHPEFEKYRAWSLINNIKIKLPEEGELHTLPFELRQRLYEEKISKIVSKTFDFVSIRRWIEKEYHLSTSLSAKAKTINYYDDHSVAGCPTIGRLQKILGDNWESWTQESDQIRQKKNGKQHHIMYNAQTLWHVCTESENETFVEDFAKNKLHFDEEQIKELVRLHKNASDEYANLSLSALQKINRFLVRGFNNYEATLLANLPSLIGTKLWKEHSEEIEAHLQDIIDSNREQKRLLNIANKLIADYNSLDEKEQCADRTYKLDDSDLRDVEKAITDSVGKVSWDHKSQDERDAIIQQVAALYQQFFAAEKRTYYKMPTDMERIREYLKVAFGIELGVDNQLYTPYDNQYYPHATQAKDGSFQLCSPVKGALRNPAAMRILHLIKRRINALLKDRKLDLTAENTRVVVELPREVNDANMRRAIDIYQNRRKKENDIFRALIKEACDDEDERLQKTRLLIEQCPDYVLADFNEKLQKNKAYNEKIEYATTKYRLWLEQGCIDLYTGQPIPFSGLFNNDLYDIEHTIPRSIVLADGLENKTITSASFNRRVKGNLLPSQLANYQSVILPNLQPWKDRVERLDGRVKYWLKETKRAFDEDRKNYCIVQRHLWQMELNYWTSKLERFLITEVTTSFVSKQMSDTRVISKYVFHYLKSFFTRVDMQYGSTTATFRKIYGLPEKDRSNHTHHAIDAAMLAFIPSSVRRDEILRLFYQIDEEKKAEHASEVNRLKAKLEQEKNFALYGSKYAKAKGGKMIDIVNQLKYTMMVNHVVKDQTLTPARKRGSIKKNGERIKIVKTGDCIRGQIHKESFFGAIKPWATDKEGNFLRDEQGLPYATNIKYVKRCKLQLKQGRGEGFIDWDDLEKRIIDKALFKQLKEQANGLSFKDACAKGFTVKRKVNGRIVENKIRHVRCEIPSNLSHFPTKKHVFVSDKDYKQYYYAESADLQYCCEYQGSNETAYVSYTLYDLSMNMKAGKEPFPKSIQGKREMLHLSRVLTKGEMVLLYKESEDELKALDKAQLAKRLYHIMGFEKKTEKSAIIKLIKHNFGAAKDEGKGKASDDFEELIQMNKIRMSASKVHFVQVKT